MQMNIELFKTLTTLVNFSTPYQESIKRTYPNISNSTKHNSDKKTIRLPKYKIEKQIGESDTLSTTDVAYQTDIPNRVPVVLAEYINAPTAYLGTDIFIDNNILRDFQTGLKTNNQELINENKNVVQEMLIKATLNVLQAMARESYKYISTGSVSVSKENRFGNAVVGSEESISIAPVYSSVLEERKIRIEYLTSNEIITIHKPFGANVHVDLVSRVDGTLVSAEINDYIDMITVLNPVPPTQIGDCLLNITGDNFQIQIDPADIVVEKDITIGNIEEVIFEEIINQIESFKIAKDVAPYQTVVASLDIRHFNKLRGTESVRLAVLGNSATLEKPSLEKVNEYCKPLGFIFETYSSGLVPAIAGKSLIHLSVGIDNGNGNIDIYNTHYSKWVEKEYADDPKMIVAFNTALRNQLKALQKDENMFSIIPKAVRTEKGVQVKVVFNGMVIPKEAEKIGVIQLPDSYVQ